MGEELGNRVCFSLTSKVAALELVKWSVMAPVTKGSVFSGFTRSGGV